MKIYEKGGQIPMTFNVRIHNIFDNDRPVKGTASVTMDGMFAVHGVKIVHSKKKGLFIAMPYEDYKDKDGKNARRDIFHPINSEARKAMEEAVLAAYTEKVNVKAETVAEANA